MNVCVISHLLARCNMPPSKQSTPWLWLLLMLVSLGPPQVGHALRMINLDAPQIALQGDTIHLSCLFKLSSSSSFSSSTKQTSDNRQHLSGGGKQQTKGKNDDHHQDDEEEMGANELLYAIKWYKDGKEFYRYLAQDWPRKQALPVDGIQLDVDKSDNHTIVLRSLTLRASGLYKCEVSTDAPRFITKSIERRLLVYAIPNKGPNIEMTQPRQGRQLFRGDSVELTCSTPESKPPLSLDWIINDTLNLSFAAHNGADTGRFFNFSSSRFVRLPSQLSTSSLAAPIAARGVSKQPPTKPSQVFYLIQNGSLASPLLQQTSTVAEAAAAAAAASSFGKPQAINLTGSLDRLAETSSSRLNFTVDANLSLYLGQLAASQRLTSSQATIAKSRGIRNTADRAESSDTTTTDRTTSTPRAKFKARGQATETVKKKISPFRPSDTRTGTIMRIRCVARVMHLSMSDEIKLNLVVDKSRDEVESSRAEGYSSEEEAKSGSSGIVTLWSVYVITLVVSPLLIMTKFS